MKLIAKFIEWFTGIDLVAFAWNSAIYAAFTALSITLMAGLIFTFKSLISTLYVATPQVIYDLWAWFAPDNTFQCITAIISGHILDILYQYKKSIAKDYMHINSKK